MRPYLSTLAIILLASCWPFASTKDEDEQPRPPQRLNVTYGHDDDADSSDSHLHEHTCCSIESGHHKCGSYPGGNFYCCDVCNKQCLIFDDDKVKPPKVCEKHCKAKETCWWDSKTPCCGECHQACL